MPGGFFCATRCQEVDPTNLPSAQGASYQDAQDDCVGNDSSHSLPLRHIDLQTQRTEAVDLFEGWNKH